MLLNKTPEQVNTKLKQLSKEGKLDRSTRKLINVENSVDKSVSAKPSSLSASCHPYNTRYRTENKSLSAMNSQLN